jgi:hypothetical protein
VTHDRWALVVALAVIHILVIGRAVQLAVDASGLLRDLQLVSAAAWLLAGVLGCRALIVERQAAGRVRRDRQF